MELLARWNNWLTTPGQNSPLATQTSQRFFQFLSDGPGQVAPGHQCEPSLQNVGSPVSLILWLGFGLVWFIGVSGADLGILRGGQMGGGGGRVLY